MKRSLYAVLVLGLALVGCSVFAQPDTPANDRPLVTVVGTQISVQPNPLRFERGRGNVHINWRLPQGAKHRFAENGIVIDGEVDDPSARELKPGARLKAQSEVVECRRTANGLQFSCLNKNSRPGVYKYTVRLVDEKGVALPPHDPSIVNMQ